MMTDRKDNIKFSEEWCLKRSKENTEPSIFVISGEEVTCEVFSGYRDPSRNAHLIAAAPELYNLLLKYRSMNESELLDNWPNGVDRALAKARGENE